MSTTIDINVTPTIQEVTINTVDNVTVINVNTITGGGGVQSVVAGTNVTVDNTDPQNPIVSAELDFNPSDYDLTDFMNNDADPFVRESELASGASPFVKKANGAIHRADVVDTSGGINSTNLTSLANRSKASQSHTDSGGFVNTSGISSHADSEGICDSPSSHADSGGKTDGGFSYANASCGGYTYSDYAKASGIGVKALSYSQTSVGSYNEYIYGNPAIHVLTDLAFDIGIGDEAFNLTSFSAYKNGGFKFISRALSNIANAVKGFFAFDENGRPNAHDGTQWNALAYLSEVSGSSTDLDYTASPTNGIVTSSTGTDATIPLANGTNAGLISPAALAQIGLNLTRIGDLETDVSVLQNKELIIVDSETSSNITSSTFTLIKSYSLGPLTGRKMIALSFKFQKTDAVSEIFYAQIFLYNTVTMVEQQIATATSAPSSRYMSLERTALALNEATGLIKGFPFATAAASDILNSNSAPQEESISFANPMELRVYLRNAGGASTVRQFSSVVILR